MFRRDVDQVSAMLETERQYFERIKPDLLRQCPDKIAVIKGEELIGTFLTMEEALAAGASRFGLENFLVRRINAPTEPILIPALSLGILRAHPALSDRGSGENA